MKILHRAPGEKVSLVNDGRLELVFLGVGGAFSEKHFQTNLLVIQGDRHVLIDFGMTGPAALKAATGLHASDIEVVLPTHSHADHVGGIEYLALVNRYIGQRMMGRPKLRMIITEEYQRILWDYTLRGGLEFNEAPGGQLLQFGDYFDVIRPQWKTFQPREVHEAEVGPIRVELFRTKHIPEQSKTWEASFVSYGVRIDGRVFVSGDTRFDPDLLRMYGDSEAFFHDVQFFPGAVHAPLSDLRALPDDVKSRMHLIHYADNWEAQDLGGLAGFAEQGLRYVF
jgi:ribonuclease BN (tRNA processing enzyme)